MRCRIWVLRLVGPFCRTELHLSSIHAGERTRAAVGGAGLGKASSDSSSVFSFDGESPL